MKILMRIIFAVVFTVFFAACNTPMLSKKNISSSDTQTGSSKQSDDNSSSENKAPQQDGTASDTGNQPPNQGSKPSEPETTVRDKNTVFVDAEALLTKHGIKRGTFTASKAAAILTEKINAEKNFNDISFKNVNIISYDDEQGTFAVEAELSKNNISCLKQFVFENFTHPLQGSYLASIVTAELNLDDGMEENLPLDEFIKKANDENSKNIGNFFRQGLVFMLQDNRNEVKLGEYSEYSLTAKLENSGNDTIRIFPIYNIKYRKLLTGQESTTVKPVVSIISFGKALIKPYFNKNDVFDYILNQLRDDFIKVDSEEFASSFYALAKETGYSPNTLLDKQQIQKYQELYKKADGHIKIKELDAGVCIKTGNITYNDFEGTLTLSYCVAEREDLAEGNYPNAKEVTQKGFKKLNEEYIKKNYAFTVVMDSLKDPAKNKETWLNTSVSDGTRLFRIEQKNTITELFKSKPFKFSLNGSQIIGEFIGAGHYGSSKGNDDKELMIQNITLSKERGEEALKITFSFDNSNNPITVSITPFYGHQH